MAKHDWLLQKLRWADASSPLGSTATIVRAQPCTRHMGVFDSTGHRIPTKHNIYVEDNLLAEVKAYMHQALASGFEATFTIMGHPCPSARPVPVNLDKLEELMVSADPPWPFSKHMGNDHLHLGRILQRGLDTPYSHLALPPGKFHGQGT